ncbi:MULTISPECIES: glutamate-5-semialdehyde dehydrogenase [unclassified Polaribacter]|uniref:glutamate-5-semialdehyde dehydrogenase n=1 Tax=unclassified Polaribacter TaxID=196858 RepID=UPI0011BF2B06|nr:MULTISPECIES: glutamate-5-semialdehyde dehydrogenase [unclassified Polaribacter]TXD50867.1 glutamate-5-semialdehyde dehydrogenase [Polaribacter sp. IC063]TXD57692.1 glutamate-5-semialdehyde dehydrogenase [Polaribacter sp. IC066]
MKLLDTTLKNNVLESMTKILDENREALLHANQKDLDAFNKEDQAMFDRLILNDKKIDGMIKAINEVKAQEDPVNQIISDIRLENGLQITNKTSPFGTIMIIYESRPDVTIEAAVLAFKANSKILLKGGKEAIFSNKILVDFWHKALTENNLSTDYIKLMQMDRAETQAFLKNPTEQLDLIVPRGGERLISFVKEHATCAVLISGRGNNFLYVDESADWHQTLSIIINAKTEKISACNALDKILINKNIENFEGKLKDLQSVLKERKVSMLVDEETHKVLTNETLIVDNHVWKEEFLALKCCIGSVNNLNEAIEIINQNSGGHSAAIMTKNDENAHTFMQQVDCAAVYKNASTRFTDGGQLGVGAELAISTDKLHHRGPLGLKKLVTNKYYIIGEGQIRS